jgi:hypothetical protein
MMVEGGEKAMDAYADLVRLQTNYRLEELRREAANDRLARSLRTERRQSLRALARKLFRRGTPVTRPAVTALRPLSSLDRPAEAEMASAQKLAS